MHSQGGRDADDADVPGRDEDGWGLFGSDGLEGLASLIGDGRDARYALDVDYTAAVRRAKTGEKRVSRVLRRVLSPGTRMRTASWSTERGEPMVRVEMEMTPEMWSQCAARMEDRERRARAVARRSLTLKGVLSSHRRAVALVAGAWSGRADE